MTIYPRDTISEAHKGAKLVKDMLEELYNTRFVDSSDKNYLKYLELAYGSALRLVMDLEYLQNAQLNLNSTK